MKEFFITKKKDQIFQIDNIGFVYSRKNWKNVDEEIKNLAYIEFIHGGGTEITEEEYNELIEKIELNGRES